MTWWFRQSDGIRTPAARSTNVWTRPLVAATTLVATLAALAVSGCGGLQIDRSRGVKPPTWGLVAGEEPRAVLVARDVLMAGGSAADAATALYFTLAVTLPSAAGLGGGGMCVSHRETDPRTEEPVVEAYLFPPRPAPGAAVSLPGNPRGFFALQARHGQRRWEELLVPAENIARFGHPVSRALATDLAQASGRVVPGTPLGDALLGPAGRPKGEGAELTRLSLAATLGILRTRGPGDLYSGQLARTFIAGAAAAGMVITPEALRAAVPEAVPPLQADWGSHVASFPAGVPQGEAAVGAWDALVDGGTYGGESPARAVDQAVATRMSPGTGGAGQEVASTGFVVVDGFGAAVACTVSMVTPFGTGIEAGNTGILLAPPVTDPRVLGLPMVVSNLNTGNLFFAGAATGPQAPAAALATALASLEAGLDASAAMAQGRAAAGAARVDALLCPDGFRADPLACRILADSQAHGLAMTGAQ